MRVVAPGAIDIQKRGKFIRIFNRNGGETLLIGIDCPDYQRYHHWEAVRVDLYVVFNVFFLTLFEVLIRPQQPYYI